MWLEKDLKFIWHPYTQMKDFKKNPPILIERGKGIKLYDPKGYFYYDTISSWWSNIHGHNHPIIKAAIKKQLDSLEHVLFAGMTHKPAILLAEKLLRLSPPGLKKVFFSDDGSTAVEVAVKMSFQYWQHKGKTHKTRFVSLDRGYHGDTIGAMSLGGRSLFNKIYSPLFFPAYKVPSPYCYRCPMKKNREDCAIDCLRPLEKLLENKSHELAGIILEPLLLAAGGMIVYPKEYLSGAAKLAKKFHLHLILDEVATGFGRTGTMFACQQAPQVFPDLICLSKGLTGGYLPMAATLTTEEIYKAFYADHKKKKTFYHGHTYTANPLGCSAALASLEIFKKEKTLENVRIVAPLLKKRLEVFKKLSWVGDVRSIGLVGAIELVKNKKTKETFSFKKRVGFKVYQEGLKKHLLLRPLGDIIYFVFPLSVKAEELNDILDKSYEVIKSLK